MLGQNRTKYCTLIILAIALFTYTHICDAQNPKQIVIFANTNLVFHRDLITGMQKQLQSIGDRTSDPVIIHTHSAKEYIAKHADSTKLVVTIGTEATSTLLALKKTFPIYSVAVPRITYDELLQRYSNRIINNNNRNFSAIYLDQPYSRRFTLIQQLIPHAKNIAVILGPSSEKYLPEIEKSAKRHGFQLISAVVTHESQIISSLDRILERSHVMLGIVDPLVFNRISARNILLTAYRWRVPLIGISPAYVRAGALASVYTTPEQIGRQLAESLKQYVQGNKNILPAPSYPKYFDVAVNYQVAEFLGIHAKSEETLKQELSRKWSSEQ
jgi:putative ABC transport system substrate-binding protein